MPLSQYRRTPAGKTLLTPHAVTVGASAQNVTMDRRRAFQVTWCTWSGPGTADFTDAHALDTFVTFAEPGSYILQLTAENGATWASDTVAVTVAADPSQAKDGPSGPPGFIVR